MKLLKQLCEIHAPSGNEGKMTKFLLNYINKEKKHWNYQPEIFAGDYLQHCIVLKFGNPRTAIFAHIDSIGFTVRYFNQLLPIGSPDAEMGATLVGEDSLGKIACQLEYDKENHAFYSFGRTIERGTDLTYKIDFRDTRSYVQSAYLDNRLGVYNALKVAEKMKDGIIVFSCWEEHGGGSVPYLIRFIAENWNVQQALVSDITWVSDGVLPGKGVAISMRDRNIPRRAYIEKIIGVARKHKIDHQLEVEGMGSSDGRELQVSPYPIDWCFVGAPEQNPHTPHEKVHKHDIATMIRLYEKLMKDL
ncbi:MAG: M20/M25/M40 family metallo-hydrolase [Bacteroidia bacterium]|nr:M20/M25/M40 family metallo-hydrolase [Bacteroidia bacterium]